MLALSQMYDEADACGIVAYVGDDPATSYLLEGLMILQNRGYVPPSAVVQVSLHLTSVFAGTTPLALPPSTTKVKS